MTHLPLDAPDQQRRRIEDFLYDEAAMLDERRFEEWLEVLTDDFQFVAPVVCVGDALTLATEPAPSGQTYYEDDKAMVEKRVRRLRMPNAWVENPPPRTCRLVGNIRIVAHDDPSSWRVRANFVIYKGRYDYDTRAICGARMDDIREERGALKLAARRVLLIDTAVDYHQIGVFF